MHKLEQTVAPATTPISTSEARTHLKIEDTAYDGEDTYVTALIEAAVDIAQERTWRQFITATYVYYLDAFPSAIIELPISPLGAVSSITYVDTDGTTQTWAASKYDVDDKAEPGRIRPTDGEVYPQTKDTPNAVAITFTAGYGSAGSDVPDSIIHALKLMVDHLYELRHPVNVSLTSGSVQQIPFPMAVDVLLDHYSARQFR